MLNREGKSPKPIKKKKSKAIRSWRENKYKADFFEYLNSRIEDSIYKVPREAVVYIGQEFWRELEMRFLNEGMKEVFCKMTSIHISKKLRLGRDEEI